MAYQIAARPMAPRQLPARSRGYLDFIRNEPCMVPGCQRGDIEAAHTGTNGLAKGRKASDLDCVPVCSYHHRTGPRPESLHSTSEVAWEAWHGLDLIEERIRLRVKFMGLKR